MAKAEMIRLAILILALTFFSILHADTLTGRVVKVADGDTITILDSKNKQHKIRLQGIDALERSQPYGRKSGKYLSDGVAGKQVTVDYRKRDRYKRIVGKVLLNGHDMNLRQIKAGLAWHYKKYQREQTPEDRQRFPAGS
jgi:endonuclease YncB( thermonuclease family)